ncbi:arf-GAP with Rho-GAP domain, ANK repeat and PH domain-containing protein 3-like [Pituophis catenifer annectens]|uniref:arf-GAP with Rho-GAP domain, ANK repeat and PH domain-containing protein 3-like n=1 Tax=Pituophis catenifer annectens TaxID=94852 RepID=UPI0039918ECD
MSTKNLALLFAPSLFQTNGKGEQEVKVIEDLIDNYVHIFNIGEDQVLQMDLENSLITTWQDVKCRGALDPHAMDGFSQELVGSAWSLLQFIIVVEVLQLALPALLVAPMGEERPLHPKEKVLEQALQWCKLPKPSSAYLLVKKLSIEEGSCLFTDTKCESPKYGLLKCREELAKLLGNKFQERYFVIKDQKLLLLKEKQSVKPQREWLLDTAKVYLGIRKKLKPPSRWGFTLILQKQQLYLTCTGQSELWDWVTSILKAQHDRICPVHLRRLSSSDLTKPKFGTMPLISLHGDSSNPVMLSVNQTLHRLHTRRILSMFFQQRVEPRARGQTLSQRHNGNGAPSEPPMHHEISPHLTETRGVPDDGDQSPDSYDSQDDGEDDPMIPPTLEPQLPPPEQKKMAPTQGPLPKGTAKQLGATSNISHEAEQIPKEYQDLAQVFSETECDVLPPHRDADCTIKIIPGAKLP